jgi:hypothetical protein
MVKFLISKEKPFQKQNAKPNLTLKFKKFIGNELQMHFKRGKLQLHSKRETQNLTLISKKLLGNVTNSFQKRKTLYKNFIPNEKRPGKPYHFM